MIDRFVPEERQQQYQLNSNQIPDTETGEISNPEIIAEDLNIPWSVAFLPDGTLLATERPGTLVRINSTRSRIEIDGVHHYGEGGLMGLALHPDFESNSKIYLYFTTRENNRVINRIESYTLTENQVSNRQIILDNIPGSVNHDGGQIAFGPDGKLYITTGDADSPNLAQDTNSLAGKILRLNDDGTIPENNPFNNAIYSYGHRNPQGLAWDNSERLWSSEHGPSGSQTGNDEINLIRSGANYGWPTIKGTQAQSGMETPILESGRNETWAPASLAYHDGYLYFGGLRGETLYRAEISSDRLSNLERLFSGEYGRIRAVTSHNNGIYFSTSNRDGRGRPDQTDDKIIRWVPE